MSTVKNNLIWSKYVSHLKKSDEIFARATGVMDLLPGFTAACIDYRMVTDPSVQVLRASIIYNIKVETF